MTLAIYQWHTDAVICCSSALDIIARPAARMPSIATVILAVGELAGARFESCITSLVAAADPFLHLARRVVKIVCIPCFETFTLPAVVRMVIAAALMVTLAAARVLCSLAAIVSPELVFGLFKAHRLLLGLGLVYKAQFENIGTPLPAVGSPSFPLARLFHSTVADQRRRFEIVGHALAHVESRTTQNQYHDAWRRAARRVRDEAIVREVVPAIAPVAPASGSTIEAAPFREPLRRAVPRVRDEAIARQVVPGGSTIGAAPLREPMLPPEGSDFWNPVHVEHSLIEGFQARFAHAVHQEALSLCRQNLYTKNEIEDMLTAFLAVLYRGTYRAIVESFRVTERELPLGSQDITVRTVGLGHGQKAFLKYVLLADGQTVIVLEEPLADGRLFRSLCGNASKGWMRKEERKVLGDHEKLYVDDICYVDGRKVTGRDAGDLEKWRKLLAELLLLINGMSASERDAFSYYLCADEERVRRVRPYLPDISAAPVLDRCFKLTIEFYTAFVAHHMPTDSDVLQEAFSLHEIR